MSTRCWPAMTRSNLVACSVLSSSGQRRSACLRVTHVFATINKKQVVKLPTFDADLARCADLKHKTSNDASAAYKASRESRVAVSMEERRPTPTINPNPLLRRSWRKYGSDAALRTSQSGVGGSGGVGGKLPSLSRHSSAQQQQLGVRSRLRSALSLGSEGITLGSDGIVHGVGSQGAAVMGGAAIHTAHGGLVRFLSPPAPQNIHERPRKVNDTSRIKTRAVLRRCAPCICTWVEKADYLDTVVYATDDSRGLPT